MGNLTRAMMMGAAGASGGKVYVDDVFSTYLYEGNGGTQSINNGIDLAGEGGLVWHKHRTGTFNGPIMFDTERFVSAADNNGLDTSGTAVPGDYSGFNSINSNGFTVQHYAGNLFNASSNDYVSWSFRKAPGFFDVVTWTGNSTVRNIAHSLGTTPGMVLVKRTSHTSSWSVWHRSLNLNYQTRLRLNDNATPQSGEAFWGNNSTAPNMNASTFSVGTSDEVNDTGKTYVAYIFAHDDAQFGTGGDESIIKCGSYTGTGTGSNPTISLGFEPQWLMIKNSTSASDSYGNADWYMVDIMREMTTDRSRPVLANSTNAESNGGRVVPTSTGFTIVNESNIDYNASGDTYIYMAIRRPNKPPEAATDVFAIDTHTGSIPNYISGFPVDFVIDKDNINAANDFLVGSRLLGSKLLKTNSSEAIINGGSTKSFDFMNGIYSNTGSANSAAYAWMFKRAPGFMDVVAYSGAGGNQNITHNLEVAPEFYMVKRRSASEDWATYSAALGANKYTKLNQLKSAYTNTTIWNNTSPTNSVFTVGNDVSVNGSGSTYIAYLVATLPGISKVGTFTGTGNAINVDCGFTNGARFVLIKRTDGSGDVGDWYVWDTARGIVSGNDPYILLNSPVAQVTNTDYLDPLGTGFTVTASAPAALNASGGTYIFLAIA